MYISVSDAANKFMISKRRVQLLCEQGRIEGAIRVSGVWLIPSDAKKPDDARKKNNFSANCEKVIDNSKENNGEKLSLASVSEILSISQATVRNWVRLGKLKMDVASGTFDKKYIESLLSEIRTGKDNRLKSRRNKKNVSGKFIYKNYIENKHNKDIVQTILDSCKQISDEELRIILANFAVQLYWQSKGENISNHVVFNGKGKITKNDLFNDLIDDLLGHIDVSEFSLKNIQFALDCKVQFVPLEDTLGFVYISLRELSQRKQSGAYFTPEKTITKLIDNLKKCGYIKSETFCDPCCGTGNFLIGLAGNGIDIGKLYGQDIDEISILITRINMFLLDDTLTKEQLESHFICGNTLLDTFSRKFTVVLGNPPWGYDFNSEEISCLNGMYITAKNKGMESYDLFVEKGISMLEDEGCLAYVLPESILTVKSHKKVRELIVKNAAFKFISFLGNVFSGVQCPSIILGLTKGYHGETKGCIVDLNNETFIINNERNIDVSSFSFNMNDDEYDCLHAISSVKDARYLANNSKFALGIVTGDNKEYILNEMKQGMERILKGSDILRYSVRENNSFIQFTPEKFQQVAATELYRAKEKLLYRFISEVPVFTYDNRQTLTLNSCNILIPEIPGMDIKYVLAILNSSVTAYYLNKKYNSVKILKSHLESVPIPLVSEEKQLEIIKKVDNILYSEKDKSELYENIDNEIFEIYSLSEQQKNIIRNALLEKNHFLSNSSKN